MDPDKFTQLSAKSINASLELAQEHGHVQLTPVHLALVLFREQGMAPCSKLFHLK
jgi:ATP-dependent Clp protease ATP-binding subunit ClpB